MYIEAVKERKPIGVLMIEHRLIERALSVLESRLEVAKAKPDVISFAEIIDFFGTYADATHHGKEEDILFVEADQIEISEELEKTLAELRDDHVRFRKYRRSMADLNEKIAGGHPEAIDDFIGTAKDFIPQLRGHIVKEDKVFFPGFDKLQTPDDREKMKQRFMDFDMEMIHESYRKVVEKNE